MAKNNLHKGDNKIIWISVAGGVALLLLIIMMFVHAGKQKQQAQQTNKGNSTPKVEQQMEQNYKQMSNSPTNSNKNSQATILYQGQPIISNDYVSIPIAIANNASNNNPLFFDTQELQLVVPHTYTQLHKHFFYTSETKATKNYTFNTYSPNYKSTNFTLNLDNGDQLQTFITFKVNNKVNTNDCRNAKVVYTTPDNTKVVASVLPKNVAISKIATNLSNDNNLINVGDYYNNLAQLVEQSKDNNQQSLNNIVKQNTNDSDYLDFYMNIYQESDRDVMLAFNNQTNSDLAFNFSNFELYDESNEIFPALYLINYTIYIPHKKHYYVLIPMQSKLMPSGNYQPRFKESSNSGSSNNSFKTTVNLPHPVKYYSNYE